MENKDNANESLQTEKKIKPAELTYSYIEHGTKFAYFEGIEYKLSKNNRMLSHDDIERALLLEEVTISDLFVLKVVSAYSWCNVEMVTTEIKRMHKIDPQKALPVASHEVIKACMSRLCKYSLVRGFEYKTNKNLQVKVYCITEAAILVLKRRLNVAVTAETFNSLNQPEEVLKRMACNYVGQFISSYKGLNEYIPGTWLYVDKCGKDYVYSQVVINTKEDTEHYVLLEPYYVRSNPLIFSKDDMITAAESRKNYVKALLNKQESTRDISLIVIVEDLNSLKKAVEYYTREFYDMLDKIYFTNEHVIFMNKDLNNSFFKVNMENTRKLILPKMLGFGNYKE